MEIGHRLTWQKRLFDLVLASVLLVILAPVMLYLIARLAITQGRPVFYVSERMKSPSQSFGLIKFRTMTVVAQDQGVSGADKNARITALGAKLRTKRLDELPQLWNILRGDLSFVGPRPPLSEYVERFPQVYDQVLTSRPGVTGLATLRFHKREAVLLGRCKTAADTDAVYCRRCIPRKAKLDVLYQRNPSLCHDMALILQTAQTVMRSKLKRSVKSSAKTKDIPLRLTFWKEQNTDD